MKGFIIPEQGHVVNILPPVDINGGVNSDVFSMEGAAHVDIIITLGVNAAATTLTIQECDNFTPSNSTAIAFDYYAETSAAGDTLAARAAATNAGISLGTTDTVMYVISIDAAQLSAGYPCLRACFSNPGASNILSAVAVLSGQRYQKYTTPTAIA